MKLNIMNANARSLNNKIGSLIESFEEFQLTIALLTETWFRDGFDLQRELLDLELGEDVTLLVRNRAGRGGGVAIGFNNKKSK